MRERKFLVAVCGPTASGKTALSIALARHFHTSIVSADSRQMYKEMTIGTAKPDKEELAAAPHHFIDKLHVWEDYNAGAYERDALDLLDKLFLENGIVVLAGGSTLYQRAIFEGLDVFPSAPAGLRQEVKKLYESKGLAFLQQEVKRMDPTYFQNCDMHNPQRLMRALEVGLSSGKPYSSFLQNSSAQRPFSIIKIGVDWPRQVLYDRINQRCDKMLESGLLDEVRRLLPYRHLNALQTVGYAEIFDHFEGKYGVPEAIALIKQHTRNYAKRQLTWFRREEGMHWLDPAAGPLPEQAIRLVNRLTS